MWCYEGKQMSHYLYSRAIELGKNNAARGSKQLYLTVYSIAFITTGCICACEVKVSDPCSHESFSALMKTPLVQLLEHQELRQAPATLDLPLRARIPRWGGTAVLGDDRAWDGWVLNRGCRGRLALKRRRGIFNWRTQLCCCGPAIAPLHLGCLSFKAEESLKMKH